MSPEEEAQIRIGARSSSASERANAFRALYQAMRERAFALCLGVCRDGPDAEDALQDAFVSIQRALGGFRGETALGSWVLRVAFHSALRARARRERHTGTEIDERTVDPGPDPEGTAEARGRARKLEQALGRLSADHRAVLSLFAIQGLGHREISEVLGIKEGTVWSRLHLARKRLAELMQE